jgi:hypothetical protein
VNRAPASAVDGDMFGSGAVARVKDVDFHDLPQSVTKGHQGF